MTRRFSRTLVRHVFAQRACLCRYPVRQSRFPSHVFYSTMSPSTFLYGYIEAVEDLEDYKPGGYHPIYIDDRLHQRYRIVHKLGHGTFSTVWLALDEQTSKYVAIKIGTADSDSRETDILSKLATRASAVAGSPAADKASMIPPIIDRFCVAGPNGTHTCLVTSPASCSIRESKEASNYSLFQLDVARSLCAQLVMAVCFIHSEGYAHGDLHPGNLLLRLPSSLNDLSVKQLYAKFGPPQREPIVRTDGKPIPVTGVPLYAVLPAWLGIASGKVALSDARLLLSDFGVAFRPSDKSCFESHTPLTIRAPEAFFEPATPLSFPSDIWSLGCVIFELLGHRSLIDGTLAPPDRITAQQVHLQGLMPSEWWDRWEARRKWFDDAGRPLGNECDAWSWDKVFEEWLQGMRRHSGTVVVGMEEKAALLDLLRWMLAWKPEARPSAEEVLDTVWMKKWALPAYEQGRKAWI
ncbi:kinase-like domain-containing protein [Xylaria palmicola]|nr:kinase-like domain-containing protein [Xylaria palmicola]